jgi:hypothetical protein
VAAAGLLAAGCGDDDERTDTSVPTTETSPATVPEPPPDTTARDEAAEEKGRAEARKRQRKRRAAQVERAVKAIAIATELETVAILADRGGERVTVALEHQYACRTAESDLEAFRKGVKAAAPRVKSVRMRGEESKRQPLEQYKEKSCRLRTSEKAPIVLERNGEGDAFMEDVGITAEQWTIEYGSSAKEFRIVLVDENDRTVLSVGKPGSGSRVVRQSGSFAIRITSSGKWTVRLRNGL